MNNPSIPNGNRILVIDDNASIHADFRKILGGGSALDPEFDRVKAELFGEKLAASPCAKFVIDSASQGQEGLEMVKRALAEGNPYALAFVDVRMPPGWDGVETIGQLWKCYPEIQIVICTAYSDYSWSDMIFKLGHSPNLVVLKKPFDNIEVLQLAHALTEKWRLNCRVRSQLENLDALVRQRTVELETTNEQLRQSQKMEAVGRLAAGVAHDFNNILAVIQGNTSLLEDQIQPDASSQELLNDIAAATERAARLVRQLLAFSRKQVVRADLLNLGEVVGKLAEMLKRLLGEHITLEMNAAPDLPPVQADPGMIEQIIVNLAMNARDAMPRGGKLAISLEPVTMDLGQASKNPEIKPGRYVCLVFSDTGCGIPPELLPRIFDPFFTTKDVGKGTGLGLAAVYGNVKQHNGWVEVQSVVNQGATFRIFLPAREEVPCSEDPHTAPNSGPRPGTECLLVVEDEEPLRKMTVAFLRKNGYCVLEAASGQDACNVFQAHASEIDLLFTDVMMPGTLLGDELADRLRATKPSLAVLFTSAYPHEVAGTMFRCNGKFLEKPFSPVQMLDAVRQCLDRAPVENGRAKN